MTMIINRAFSDVVEQAIRELVSASHRPEGSYVRTPLLYPSGSQVVIRISGTPSEFFVTDFGMGYTEAEMMGHERTYSRTARNVSDSSGVGFDEHSFFVLRADLDQLPGAIASVANCSYEAVAQTAYKSSEKASADGAVLLIEKLERVFGSARILRRPKIIGASSHEWEFSASVSAGTHNSVFEFATKHPNSVASVAMKMNDIALLERSPRRIVMVHRKPELGTYLGVLAHISNVIEENIPETTLRHLAEAA